MKWEGILPQLLEVVPLLTAVARLPPLEKEKELILW
jgi:hypothetical protein